MNIFFENFSLGEVLRAKAMGKLLVPIFLSTFGNMTHPKVRPSGLKNGSAEWGRLGEFQGI